MKTTSSELRMFFLATAKASSSSCCNPAIKIVFHSAFALYITKATTVFFTFSNVDSFTEPKKKKKRERDREQDRETDNLPVPFLFNPFV